ncbi:MAG: DUF3426 domain-containing protein [Desulfobacterales bacterium]
MIITCEECNSSFNVNDSLIKDGGSKVRCSKCDSVFVAYPPMSDDDLALDSDERMPEQDEEFELEDLDSSLGDFLSEDEAAEMPKRSSDTQEIELDLDDDLENLESFSEEEEAEASGFEDLELEMDDETLGESENSELGLDDEGDLDLSDLGLEEEDLSAQPAADAEASDLELGFEETDQDEGEIGAADLNVEGADELDLSDLEQAIDSDASTTADVAAKPENLNLSLEAEELEDPDAGLEMEASEELDLSDLEIDMEETAVSEDASAGGSDDADFDLDLDLEAEAGTEPAEAGADELDLSDLSDIMGEEAVPAADSQPDELNLELEPESDSQKDEEAPAIVDDSEGIDELDLSDLGDFMETADSTASRAEDDDTTEELDLQMEENASPADAAANAGDELDFSDLEQLLESDETPTIEAADAKNTEAIEFQFDPDQPSDDGEFAAAAGQDTAAAEDNDFLDIEQMLEEGQAATSEPASDNAAEVTDLPLEMEAALDEASSGAEAELELDFDLESELQEKEDLFDSGSPDDQQMESNLHASDELDFLEDAGMQDTQFKDGSGTSAIDTDDFDSEELSETQSAYGATHVLATDEDAQPDAQPVEEEFYEEEPVVHRTGSRSKKPVLVVLLLLFLAAGVVVVPNMLGIKVPYISDIKIPYLSDLKVKIPYVSDWLNPEEQDLAGNLKLIPLSSTINGKFVDNSRAGQIFVIQGQIKNDYSQPRSHIKVTGKLYQKGNKMAKQATVYCGNVLTDSDLAAMDIATIKKRLMNQTGDRRTNWKVKTGKTVPFMIVFDHLPKNLDEFTVEVAGSSI